MLPFLKLKNQSSAAGIMTKMRKPDEKPIDEENIGKDSDDEVARQAIESCSKDLIRAVHAQDHKGVAKALQAAFEILETMPHEEGEHIEPHSYDSQNEKAAKGQD